MKLSYKLQIAAMSLLIFTLLGLALPITAQELPETGILDNNSNTTILSEEPNALPLLNIDLNKKTTDTKLIDISGEKDKEKSFLMQPEFANRGKALEKKLNKKDKEVKEEYRSNQYLGDFKSNARFVKVVCRDHEYVDGDRVKVYVNDKVIQHDILLDEKFYGFEITLEKGFNKIDFQALNQGSSGPNTAEFRVYDDKGNLVSSNQWNLATGVKATLIIVKE